MARCLVLLSSLVLGAGSAGAQTSSFSIRTSASFQRLGAWRIDLDPTLRGAREALGPESACRIIRFANHGRATWSPLGVSIDLLTYGVLPKGKNACTAPARIRVNWVRVTGTQWITSRGLRVGDSVAKLRRLDPRAGANLREHWPNGYWLVTRRTACLGLCPTRFVAVPQLLAETRGGRTIAFSCTWAPKANSAWAACASSRTTSGTAARGGWTRSRPSSPTRTPTPSR